MICVNKTAEQLLGTTASNSDFGQVNTPKFGTKGLAGCVFEVKDSKGTVVATLTTDAKGYAETGLLEFGEYKVQEVSSVAGYEVDNTVHTVTIILDGYNRLSAMPESVHPDVLGISGNRVVDNVCYCRFKGVSDSAEGLDH